MAYKQFTTLNQVRNADGRIYVRWSQSIAKDIKRGYSLAYGTSAEAGLSCGEIDKEGEDYILIRQLTEYKYLCGGNCWIITGDEVGAGEDNEPLLRNVTVVGKVSKKLTDQDYRKLELDQDIERLELAIANSTSTDEIGKKISADWLAGMRKERLEKYGY